MSKRCFDVLSYGITYLFLSKPLEVAKFSLRPCSCPLDIEPYIPEFQVFESGAVLSGCCPLFNIIALLGLILIKTVFIYVFTDKSAGQVFELLTSSSDADSNLIMIRWMIFESNQILLIIR